MSEHHEPPEFPDLPPSQPNFDPPGPNMHQDPQQGNPYEGMTDEQIKEFEEELKRTNPDELNPPEPDPTDDGDIVETPGGVGGPVDVSRTEED